MEKKTWQKPELISLTRCKTPEAVLSTCKYYQMSGDPGTNCAGCLQDSQDHPCDDCSGYYAS